MKIQLPAGGWRPRGPQIPLWSYLENGGKNAVAVWHRRYGKDEVALRWTSVAMIERPGTYWHMLPEATQARKAIWEAINPHTGRRRIDEAFPKELRKATRENEMFIRFGESTWQVVGSDNFNSLVGSPPIGVVYSEWPLANPSAAAYLRPIMTENDGWQMFIYTPRGRNHGLTTYERAKKDPSAFAQRLTVDDTKAIKPEVLAKELEWYKSEYGAEDGEAFYRQEFYCDFNAPLIGAILGRYIERAERSNRVSDDVKWDPEGAPIEISSDIGFRDTAVWWFWQPKIGGYTLVDCDSDRGLEADDWIERIQAKGYDIGHIWLPKDAKAKTFQSKHSAMERFLKKFGSNIVRVTPSESIVNRINAARRVIEKCEFAQTACSEGLEGLRAWSFEWDDDLKVYSKDPKHDWCLASGTQVLTPIGWKEVQTLKVHNKVLTPYGERLILRSGIVRRTNKWTTVQGIRCTPEHRFFTTRGLVEAGNLSASEKLWTQDSLGLTILAFLSAVFNLGLKDAITLATREGKQKKGLQSSFIGWCMRLCMAKYRLVMKSIMSMMTHLITTQTTLKHSLNFNIAASTNQFQDIPVFAYPAERNLAVTKNGVLDVVQNVYENTELDTNDFGNKKTEPAYNLTVDIDQCYFVKGNDGKAYLVSNSSHFGDSFSYGAQVMEQAEARAPKEDEKSQGLILNDLWAEHERALTRVQRI